MSGPPSQVVESGEVKLVILGTSQDGGVPQAGCGCSNCSMAIEDPSLRLHPVSCAIRGSDGSIHIIEATRSLAEQLSIAASVLGEGRTVLPETVCLTHSHLGHIDGLGQFGNEAMGLENVPLFASESVQSSLRDRYVLSPFRAIGFTPGHPFYPSEGCGFTYTMVPVPHRDEVSDTHAVLIRGPMSSLLFLPDHDGWSGTLNSAGAPDLRNWLGSLGVEFALLDGTFWDSKELPGRDMSQIPHPPIEETLERLGDRVDGDPEIMFFHLNHTNPVLGRGSVEREKVISMGWSIAEQGSLIVL